MRWGRAWWCKIGPAAVTQLPKGADWPMRKAVQRAFRELTGRDADYVFSGWGAALTEGEHAVAYPQQKEAGDA